MKREAHFSCICCPFMLGSRTSTCGAGANSQWGEHGGSRAALCAQPSPVVFTGHTHQHETCRLPQAAEGLCWPSSKAEQLVLLWGQSSSPIPRCKRLHSGACVCSRVCLFGTPWPVACEVPLSVVLSRQEYWNGLPFPSPGDQT